MQKNNYDAQYELITGKNDNVSSSSDLKDFFILCGGIVIFVIIFIAIFQICSDIYISSMSTDTQLKIEKRFVNNKANEVSEKYRSKIDSYYEIEKRIIKCDKNIQHKNIFPLYMSYQSGINAAIYPNGSIVLTEGLLNENFTEDEMTFILAHEIGHYSHRDHLRSISKKIAIISLGMFLGHSSELNSIVSGVTDIDRIRHSKRQERNADIYAGEVLYKIYGTNQAGINVMQKLKEKETIPEFFYYVYSHPATEKRIESLKQQQKELSEVNNPL